MCNPGSGAPIDAVVTAADLGQGNPEHQAGAETKTENVLEIDRLSVEFPGAIGSAAFKAVDDVTFSIDRGKTLGLVGESGSGKSTIGRCVAALQKPTTGTVTNLGQDITTMTQKQLRRCVKKFGFVFQDPATSLNPRLRVGDCVAEPLKVHKVMRGAECTARVAELLDAVRLPKDTAARYPHELSGGQRQRANLARALALSPDLLVADEPTSALDVSVQASVLDLFEELQREWAFACLFISHDLAVVDRLADDVAVLRDGRTGTAAATPQSSAVTCAPTPAGSPKKIAAVHHYPDRHQAVVPGQA